MFLDEHLGTHSAWVEDLRAAAATLAALIRAVAHLSFLDLPLGMDRVVARLSI